MSCRLVLNLNNGYLGNMVKQWQDMIYSGRHSQSLRSRCRILSVLLKLWPRGDVVTDPAVERRPYALEQVKTTACLHGCHR